MQESSVPHNQDTVLIQENDEEGQEEPTDLSADGFHKQAHRFIRTLILFLVLYHK